MFERNLWTVFDLKISYENTWILSKEWGLNLKQEKKIAKLSVKAHFQKSKGGIIDTMILYKRKAMTFEDWTVNNPSRVRKDNIWKTIDQLWYCDPLPVVVQARVVMGM